MDFGFGITIFFKKEIFKYIFDFNNIFDPTYESEISLLTTTSIFLSSCTLIIEKDEDVVGNYFISCSVNVTDDIKDIDNWIIINSKRRKSKSIFEL